MQPTMCSRCHKHVAVVFITKLEGGQSKNEGLCLKCAKELGIKPIDDMIQKMGITDEDLENLTSEMMSAFGGAEGMEGLMPQDREDGDEDDGRTATFPFLNQLFGAAAGGDAEPKKDAAPRPDKNGGKGQERPVKRKFLENYCISLTQRAQEGKLDRLIGRERELERVIQILNRRQKNNPCLIGEPGVGKTAIAEGLAMKIAKGDVPYKLLDKEVYLLDLTALVAGTQFRGQFESRMKGLIEEIKKLGNIILVIDEVHNIVGAGDAEGSMNAANILKPALSRGELQVIGATTLNEYRKHIEKDTALERRFQPVIVEEPSIEDSVQIIEGIAPYYEAYHQVVISPEMCRLAVTMSERYITDRFLPDKAIDLIDEACSDVNLHNKTLAREVEVKKELDALEKLGVPGEFTDRLPLPFPVAGAVRYPNQAQFHPLKWIAAISKSLHICEHTPVRELVGTTAITDYGKVTANKIIVATHFPFLNKHGSFFAKLYQHRSYVIALENAPNVDGMYVDEAQTGMSFRNYKNLLLVGGGDHRTGKQGGAWQELRDFAQRHYPKAAETSHWATQDCMSLDGVPYIGPYSASTSDLYVATGFNKWGMTSAMVSAMVLCDLVQGKQSPYAEVFSPSRTILRPQLAVNGFEAVVNLLTPSAKRCPHLGCALKWNPQEHTWDCPCHGSRFTEEGRLIDNPATGNLKK